MSDERILDAKIRAAMGHLTSHRRYRKYTTEEIELAREAVARRRAENGETRGKYGCLLCGGLGWVYVSDTTDIHDPLFGRTRPCTCVNPVDLYGAHSGLQGDEFQQTWTDIEGKDNVMDAVWSVRKVLDKGYGWVYIHGDYGVAKTLILKIATAEHIKAGVNSAYARMAEIIDHLRQAYDKNDPSAESQRRLDRWADIPLLCIDEFDRVRDTEYSIEKRFVLMDRRYEDALRGRSITIMAANTHPDKLEGYLADRIMDRRFSVVHITGRSYRRDLMD